MCASKAGPQWYDSSGVIPYRSSCCSMGPYTGLQYFGDGKLMSANQCHGLSGLFPSFMDRFFLNLSSAFLLKSPLKTAQ